MMQPADVANLVAYALQVAVVIVACAPVPRLLRLHSPGVQYVFWRAVLAACLVLPVIQPWRHMAVVAATIFSDARDPASRTMVDAAVSRGAVWLPNPALVAAVLAAGTLVRLAWLGLGLVHLRRLRASAVADAPDPAFDDVQAAIGADARVCWSDAVDHPVTFGLRHPIVVLPSALARLDGAAVRAVVAHELFHVRRRDWGWQIGEEIVRALFWFHPAMTWLVTRVQLSRETVVDELSILATNARRAYMDALLAFADDPALSSASAFSRRRHLVHRITLLSREGSMSTTRVTIASLVLCAVLGVSAVSAARAFPLLQVPRDPVPGQLSPEQRAVLDRAVERARAALTREPQAPDLHHQLATALWAKAAQDPQMGAADRAAAIGEAIAAENAALQVRPDYADALRMKSTLLRLQAARTIDPGERAKLLADADETAGKAAGAGQAGPEDERFAAQLAALKPLRIGGDMKPPSRIKNVNPVYPPDAKAAGVQGVVIIEALVDATGHVTSTRVLRGIPMLDEAAVDAVRQWEYTPVLLNGAPVPVLMTTTINFTLQD